MVRAGAAGVPTVTHRWAAAMVLGSAVLLVVFDSLSVATALPVLGADLRLNAAGLQWVVNLYSLSIGGLLLLGGRVVDTWGQRRVLTASLALLTMATVLSGTAPGLPALLTGRLLQGVAAAFALPASLAMTATLFPEEPWRSRAFSVISISGGTAALVGAVCGGLLTATLGWRWVFLATVPVTLLALAGAMRFLPADRGGRSRSRRLDLTGAILATAGPVGLVFGISRVGASSLSDADVVGPVLAGLALLAALVAIERRVPDPLVRVRLLRSPRLAGGCLAIAAHSAVHSAIVVVGSLHLQDVYRLSPAGAGVALAPALLAHSGSSLVAPSLIRRFGSRRVAVLGLGMQAFALALLAANAQVANYLAAVVPGFLLRSLGGGFTYVSLTREVIGGASAADRGATSGMFEATTHIGGAIAVATYVTLIGSALRYSGAYGAAATFAFGGGLAALLLLRAPRAPR